MVPYRGRPSGAGAVKTSRWEVCRRLPRRRSSRISAPRRIRLLRGSRWPPGAPSRGGAGLMGGLLRSGPYGEPAASLPPAAGQGLPTPPGLHPGTEPVLVLPLAIAGPVCGFHPLSRPYLEGAAKGNVELGKLPTFCALRQGCGPVEDPREGKPPRIPAPARTRLTRAPAPGTILPPTVAPGRCARSPGGPRPPMPHRTAEWS